MNKAIQLGEATAELLRQVTRRLPHSVVWAAPGAVIGRTGAITARQRAWRRDAGRGCCAACRRSLASWRRTRRSTGCRRRRLSRPRPRWRSPTSPAAPASCGRAASPSRHLHVIVKGVVELRQTDEGGGSELVETLGRGGDVRAAVAAVAVPAPVGRGRPRGRAGLPDPRRAGRAAAAPAGVRGPAGPSGRRPAATCGRRSPGAGAPGPVLGARRRAARPAAGHLRSRRDGGRGGPAHA